LHVGHLTRNVQAEHIQEIFSTFGTVKHVELAMDKAVNLPRGFAYVEFSKRSEAEDAQRLMDGGQLDGNQLRWVALARSATCSASSICNMHASCIAPSQSPRSHCQSVPPIRPCSPLVHCYIPLQHVGNVALLTPYRAWCSKNKASRAKSYVSCMLKACFPLQCGFCVGAS